jgi:hypothetical protein
MKKIIFIAAILMTVFSTSVNLIAQTEKKRKQLPLLLRLNILIHL